MKLPTKPLVVAGIVGTVGIATLTGASIANAETNTDSTKSDPSSNLIDKLVSTFNLDKDKVQEVFDEERAARETERETQRSQRLQKLVDDSTITAAQKTAIENKLKEMKAEREADRDGMQNLTDEERRAKMDEKRTALETWAEQQGLDLSKLKGVLGGHGGGGPRPE